MGDSWVRVVASRHTTFFFGMDEFIRVIGVIDGLKVWCLEPRVASLSEQPRQECLCHPSIINRLFAFRDA